MSGNKRAKDLILWQVYNTKVHDIGAKQFALVLCQQFQEDQLNVRFTDVEIATLAGISKRSVPTYAKQLVESGEWSVKPVQKIGTTYTPLFEGIFNSADK